MCSNAQNRQHEELESLHAALVKLAEETGYSYEGVLALATELCDFILREENVHAH